MQKPCSYAQTPYKAKAEKAAPAALPEGDISTPLKGRAKQQLGGKAL